MTRQATARWMLVLLMAATTGVRPTGAAPAPPTSAAMGRSGAPVDGMPAQDPQPSPQPPRPGEPEEEPEQPEEPTPADADTPTPVRVKENVEVEGAATLPLDPGVPAQFAVDAQALASLRGALLDDPMRALQALPGVGTTDELRADLSVRGSPFRHVGLVIDDVKSRLLMHTVRGVEQTGSVALLNGDTVAAATLSAGSYPQRYVGSVGAELAVRTRDGRADRLHGRLMSSLIATTASMDGPLGDRVTWMLAARRSYASWIVTRIDPDLSGTFDFQDAFAKARARIGSRQHVSLTWLGGASEYDERGRRSAPWALDVGRNRTHLVTGQWQATPGASWLVAQRAAYVSAHFRNHNPVGRILDDGREQEWSSRSSATWTRAGLSVDASLNAEGVDVAGEAVRFGGGVSGETRRFDGRTSRLGGHVHVQAQPHARLHLGAGSRVDRIDGIGVAASPWAQAAWVLGTHWRVQVGTGLHRQAPELLMRVGPNAGAGLTFESARHLDLGLQWQHGAWSGGVTAYHRHEWDVLDTPGRLARRLPGGGLSPGDPRAAWDNVLGGDATGLEWIVRRQSARWGGWASYAFGRFRQHSPGGDPSFAGAFEQRHLVSVTGTATFSPRWDGSAVVRVASNWPYDGYFRGDADRVFLDAARNGLRLPVYGRVDLRLRHVLPLGTRRLVIFGEAINLLNRRNVRQVEGSFDPRSGEVFRVSEEQLPILPSIGLAFEW